MAKKIFVVENGVLKKYNGNGGSVIIPDNVTSIGEKVFMGCTNLKNITIPNNVESIGHWAFRDCKGLADKDGFVIVKGVFFPNVYRR